MTRNQRRLERIKKDIPIAQLLSDLGYPVRPDAAYREQQFSCDLHGTRDIKPSARVYPDNNAWYCFAESKHRDAVQTIRDKLELPFNEALKWLEDKYNLPFMPFEEGDRQGPTFNQELALELDPTKTYEQDRARTAVLLDNITGQRILDMNITTSFWEAVDRLTYMVTKEQIDDISARKALLKIRERVMLEWKMMI